MDFTFGIITNAKNGVNPLLIKSIESIEKLKIPNHEIIVVGGGNLDCIKNRARVIPFDEGQKKGWITRKKNIITDHAKFENIVYAHDYINFDDNWYDGFLKFGDDWKIVMNKIYNEDGIRFRDWSVFPHQGLIEPAKTFSSFAGHECLIPYSETGFTRLQYISGSYWTAKKEAMKRFRLNESLCHCGGEDVEWSYRVREKYKFSMNVHSSVTFLKWKDRAFYEMRPEVHQKMKQFLQMRKLYG